MISRPRSFGWPLQLQEGVYNANTQTDKSQAGGQHAKVEAGWEEERTGGGAVQRGEGIGNGCGCLPGAWGNGYVMVVSF